MALAVTVHGLTGSWCLVVPREVTPARARRSRGNCLAGTLSHFTPALLVIIIHRENIATAARGRSGPGRSEAGRCDPIQGINPVAETSGGKWWPDGIPTSCSYWETKFINVHRCTY